MKDAQIAWQRKPLACNSPLIVCINGLHYRYHLGYYYGGYYRVPPSIYPVEHVERKESGYLWDNTRL